jgi:hypothetical protein
MTQKGQLVKRGALLAVLPLVVGGMNAPGIDTWIQPDDFTVG